MTFRSYGHKPWGHYLNIFDASYTKVKEICIKPGEAPSYQYHHKRSEIWVIVKGTAEIKLDGEVSSESTIYAWGACPLQLRVTTSEKLRIYVYLNSGGTHSLTGSTILVPGVWYHVAAIVSESEDFMGLYINGTQDASFSLTSSDTMYHWSGNDMIGYTGSWWSSDYFEGIIDEIRISNVSRASDFDNFPADNDNITFKGSATDQSGSVEAYSWTSSIDGELSTQAIFTIHESNLSFGNHTITFKAQDETGAWSIPKTTNIIVRSFPYAKITSVEPFPT